ncbi:MAG TPA: sodium-translocating pyrophosphatase [Kiritimatiellia bacterium]|nr:sodium-translocating pyrophosphatase [Kiritimatiellia bacterium]HRZ13154.1 sodium-translocating pyrophosphatase [Kiritimatiellia bacterium]HSA17575.1 sodium-translocating pyrophosphatase [Kiritimatiellia bacterium]
MDMTLLYMSLGAGVLALVFAFVRTTWINKQDPGTPRMQEIGAAVREGAMAFLKREYKVLAVFVVVVAALLAFLNIKVTGNKSLGLVALSFVVGAFCSVLSGFFGMRVATAANMRTTNAARQGLPQALAVAFAGGSVMGMCVVGLGLLGLSALTLAYLKVFGSETAALTNTVLPIITGFSMGASSIALFARVGGGIYTKAADVGADLVGKVEAGIPEDDPRNPAVIADNVGDNVGDVAGMGADLFESYVGAIVSAMVLAAVATVPAGIAGSAMNLVLLPLVIAGVGIVFSITGTFMVKTKEGGNPQKALNAGSLAAAAATAVASYFVIAKLAPAQFSLTIIPGMEPKVYQSIGIFWATIAGLAAGVAIGFLSEYYTAEGKGPSNRIADSSTTGAATNIIAGLGNGMLSTAFPTILLGAAILVAYKTAGLYGIAIAGLGMLATTGIQLAVDAYGPIADNAGGLAEMAHLEKEVRQRTDKLDACGNTTAAIGKGFAIGSAALTALALFAAFGQTVGLTKIDVMDPNVTAGLLLGAMMPFLFSAFAMNAVGQAAFAMVEEVRRQFKSIPGLLEGKEGVRADYARCVDISTAAAIKKMTVPALLGVLTPVVIGFVFGTEMLGGLLAGVTVTGVMMALFMANAGGAWDNAKKHIEAGALGGKGSPAHKAAVVGDTVGDPFKDTAGPSLNILMKLMSVVALVIAPILKAVSPLLK